jgi:hypothetical protein
MRNMRHATVGFVAGGLLSLGSIGAATAQTEDVQRLEIGAVAEELALDEQTASELAPLLETLNDVFERREEHFRQGDAIYDDLAEAYDQIAETLSATQLREFHWLLRENAVGLGARRQLGGYMMGGRLGGAFGGKGFAMRGGRGNYGRGIPMRGARGYAGQRMPLRGTRGYDGWNVRPGWRYDDSLPNN